MAIINSMSEEQVKLSIKLDNVSSIELHELTKTLNALVCEYDLYCNEEFKEVDKKLRIVKIEKGSLLIELMLFAPDLFEHTVSIAGFAKYFIDAFSYFIKGGTIPLPNWFGKSNCDNLYKFLGQTASNNGSNIIVTGNNNEINITSDEAKIGQEKLAERENQFLEEEFSQKTKQEFNWETASFVKGLSGNKDSGIIKSIDKKAHRIIFTSDADKKYMTTSKLGNEWQYLQYIVDVKIIRVQDKIKVYEILKVHEKDAIKT